MAYQETDLVRVKALKQLAVKLNSEIAVKTIKVNGTALTADASKAVDILIDVKKKATANTGAAHSYQLEVNGVALSQEIDIPKDFLVKSGTVETVTAADQPVSGYVVGQKYLDFVVNSVDNDATAQHIYVLVNDLIKVYTEGNGIDIDNNNQISVVIDPANANGLSVTANGIGLALATGDTDDGSGGTIPGKAGAISAAAMTKLNHISNEANKVTVPATPDGTILIDGSPATVVEIATDAEIADMLAEVFGS